MAWYNTEHRHSAIRFVTPDDRHLGRESALLVQRHQVYQRARVRHPEHWSRDPRDWMPAGPARLGPSPNLTLAVQVVKRIGRNLSRDNYLDAHRKDQTRTAGLAVPSERRVQGAPVSHERDHPPGVCRRGRRGLLHFGTSEEHVRVVVRQVFQPAHVAVLSPLG
ncbi:hypothetical protein [Myxococcus sp. MxC21-1]|uniref:hypothetical protein n=1 Tax=Myxococcus sp. MxC21-1 TaxID=3041439 RepID=UPI003977297D